jgi:RND family efflux transporter MFP subunit
MRKKVLLPLLILVITAVITAGMLRMREQPEQSAPTEAVVLVETMALSPVDTRISVQSQGTVEARTRTSLVSEVSGKVSEVSPTFVAGGFFRKGEVLLRLDDSNYRTAVSRSEAALATARSALALEQGQADVSQREWDRMSPEQQARISGKELYLRKPQVAEVESRLEAAEADLEEARRNLAKTSIVAPYDGLVSSKSTDIGQFVNAGSVLAETFAVDYAEVRLPIPETKLAFLDLPVTLRAEDDTSEGPEVELISSMGSREYRWHGHLTRTEGVLDIRTRVLYSVVQVKDPYGLYGTERSEPLRIGTYVNAAIAGQELKGVYVLPRHTLQAGDIVWVADQENRLRAREVTIVTVNGDDAFVSKGLLPGDRVVITRMENPLNGMAVQTSALYAPVN